MPDFKESVAVMKRLMEEELKLDCFRLLAEMDRANVNNLEAARRLGVAPSTIHGWKMGCEPRWSDGQRLIALHDYVTADIRKNESTSS